MYDRSLCHELGHLFGLWGLTGIWLIDVWNYAGVPIANSISDTEINHALNRLENNEVRKGVDWVDDYRTSFKVPDAKRIVELGPRGLKYFPIKTPTTYDIYRFGARMLREKKQ